MVIYPHQKAAPVLFVTVRIAGKSKEAGGNGELYKKNAVLMVCGKEKRDEGKEEKKESESERASFVPVTS